MPRGGNRGRGDWGETQACGFLARHGFRVIERNFQTPAGEIDIIASYGGDYYFVEVKTRIEGDMAYDTALTGAKKHRLKKTVAAYCFRRSLAGVGVVLASLLVVVSRADSRVRFRLAVLY